MTPSARAGISRPLRVGLLGLGNVGSALLEIVDDEANAIAERSGINLEITQVVVKDLDKTRKHDLKGRVSTDAKSLVSDTDIDVVVELIGGIEPARSLIVAALQSGKPVVTANKELLARHGAELFAIARQSGVPIRFEAAVGGAIPLVRALQVSLAGERIERVMGIVNGTTNFILSAMTEGHLSYREALAEAERLGYAERDPSADVGGYDASCKAAIIAAIAFNTTVSLDDVHCEGIEGIEVEDIDFANRLGYVIKLLAVAERGEAGGHSIGVRVHPAMVPLDHPLAGVRGPYNALFIEGANAGELMLYGRGAGGRATASAVLGDLIEVAHDPLATPSMPSEGEAMPTMPISELSTQYYLTIDVADQPGVLADVAAVFGAHGVSIRSMEQVGLAGEARLVFITHRAREADLQATLADMAAIDSVEHIGSLLRVIGPER